MGVTTQPDNGSYGCSNDVWMEIGMARISIVRCTDLFDLEASTSYYPIQSWLPASATTTYPLPTYFRSTPTYKARNPLILHDLHMKLVGTHDTAIGPFPAKSSFLF